MTEHICKYNCVCDGEDDTSCSHNIFVWKSLEEWVGKKKKQNKKTIWRFKIGSNRQQAMELSASKLIMSEGPKVLFRFTLFHI